MIGRNLRENPIKLQTGISDVPNSMILLRNGTLWCQSMCRCGATLQTTNGIIRKTYGLVHAPGNRHSMFKKNSQRLVIGPSICALVCRA